MFLVSKNQRAPGVRPKKLKSNQGFGHSLSPAVESRPSNRGCGFESRRVSTSILSNVSFLKVPRVGVALLFK